MDGAIQLLSFFRRLNIASLLVKSVRFYVTYISFSYTLIYRLVVNSTSTAISILVCSTLCLSLPSVASLYLGSKFSLITSRIRTVPSRSTAAA
jgi:hypothetical protein